MEKESLSFTWVENNNLWITSWSNSEHIGEIWFSGSIYPTKQELNSSWNFAFECLAYILKNISLFTINFGIAIDENNTECSIFFQTNIISTIFSHLWYIDNQPWFSSTWCFNFIFLCIWVNEYLRMNVNEFKNRVISELFSSIFYWLSFCLKYEKCWELLNLISSGNCLFAIPD